MFYFQPSWARWCSHWIHDGSSVWTLVPRWPYACQDSPTEDYWKVWDKKTSYGSGFSCHLSVLFVSNFKVSVHFLCQVRIASDKEEYRGNLGQILHVFWYSLTSAYESKIKKIIPLLSHILYYSGAVQVNTSSCNTVDSNSNSQIYLISQSIFVTKIGLPFYIFSLFQLLLS